VITAVAFSRVKPAGVVRKAFDVSGPPLEKSSGLAAAVIVIIPSAPKSAVSETKSPLSEWLPGRTKTQTSWPGKGPPPSFISHSCVSNPAAVVGTLPGLMLTVWVVLVVSAVAAFTAGGTKIAPTARPVATIAPPRQTLKSTFRLIVTLHALSTGIQGQIGHHPA
jgi:hypothetical protein